MPSLHDLDDIFKHRFPTPKEHLQMSKLQSAAKALAVLIVELTPQSREQSLALTNVQQAVLWAHAAILHQ